MRPSPWIAAVALLVTAASASAQVVIPIQARFGRHIIEETLLRPGTPRRDWKSTLLSDGHVVIRHPDMDEARRMAFAAATDIQLYAS